MRRYGLMLGAFGCVAILTLLAYVVANIEPRRGGKSLSAWLTQYQTSKNDAAKVQQAADNVRHMGKRAVPYLLQWVRNERPAWKNRLISFEFRLPAKLTRTAFWTHLTQEDSEYETTLKAFSGFEILGGDAASAIPSLRRLMNQSSSPNNAWRAQVCLVFIGGEGLKVVKACKEPKFPKSPELLEFVLALEPNKLASAHARWIPSGSNTVSNATSDGLFGFER